MNIWKKFPFLRFTFFLIFGILLNIYLRANFLFLNNLFWYLSVLFLILVLYDKWNKTTNLRSVISILIYFNLIATGFVITEFKTDKYDERAFINYSGELQAIKGVIVSGVQDKGKTYKSTFSVSEIYDGENWHKVKGKILLYIQKNSKLIYYGDELLVFTKPSLTKKPMNPSEFNYKQYLEFHSIYHQAYCDSNNYVKVADKKGSSLIYLSYRIREFFEEKMTEYIVGFQEKAIIKALVLGIKDDLDNEISKAYSNVGAMHVLAVSGLHVGLLYKILSALFSWIVMINKKNGALIKSIVVVFFIWCYAFITGLSPSVLRAATMFSFMAFASATKRNSNIYNTLALSAFLLLVINPYLIMQVGFQLSFLAVIGIVYIQPKLYNLLNFDNSIIDWVWTITTVSIAAQLATFPLGLLYFHQFPTYFLISNLVVIPAAVLILHSGLLILVVCWIPFLHKWLSFLVEKSIYLTNKSIFILEKLPLSLIGKIDISIFETYLIYLLIVFLLVFLVKKKLVYYSMFILFSCMLITSQLFEKNELHKTSEIIINQVNKHQALSLIDGKKHYFLSDSALYFNDQKMLFHINHYLWKKEIDSSVFLDLDSLHKTKLNTYKIDENVAFIWKGKSFLIYETPLTQTFKYPLQFNYIVLRNSPFVDYNRIEQSFYYDKIIVDGSNNFQTAFWTEKKLKNVYNTALNGYLRINL